MIVPIQDRLLIEHLELTEQALPSGLVLPESAADSPSLAGSAVLAKVLAVGPGRRDKHGRLVPMSCKPEDVVLVQAGAGAKPEPLQPRLRILRDDGVLAVVEDPQRYYGGAFLR